MLKEVILEDIDKKIEEKFEKQRKKRTERNSIRCF